MSADGPGGEDVRSVLSLMSGALRAAMTADIDLLLPSELSRDEDGRLVLRSLEPEAPGPEDAPLMAPELPHTGPTPASLVFTVAALGAKAALGSWSPPPSPEAHGPWLEALEEQLGRRLRSPEAVTLLRRCLQADPLLRPHPRHLAETLAELGARGEPPSRSRAARLPSPPSPAERWLKSLIALLLGVSALLVLLASAGLGLLYLGEPQAPAETVRVAEDAPAPAEPPAAPEPLAEPVALQPVAQPAAQPPVPSRPAARPAPQALVPPEPAPAPVPGPEAPAPGDQDDKIENDLIDPWEDP